MNECAAAAGESRQDVLHYVNVTGVAKDARYARLSLTGQGQEASGVSDCRGAVFARISQAVLETLQDPKVEALLNVKLQHLYIPVQ
jgi:hypothetical protein